MNLSGWKIEYEREEDGINILHAECEDRIAVLPEEIEGLPVVSIGKKALSNSENRKIEELTLPSGLLRVGNEAFAYLDSLRTICLCDVLESFGANALAGCPSLERIKIRKSGKPGLTLGHIAESTERMLDISMEEEERTSCRLIFPSYEEQVTDDGCIAQGYRLSYHINGAGYPYHHCFLHKEFDIKAYDRLWREYTVKAVIPEEALRLAWYRLVYPEGLSEKSEKEYRMFVSEKADDMLALLVSDRDRSGLSFLFSISEPSEAAIKKALERSRENALSELIPLLLEKTRSLSRTLNAYEL